MTSLEALEKYKRGFVTKEYEIIEKSLKAVSIIKSKRVNVRCLMSGWNLGKYNSYKTHESLTEKEFDLLKEVFG